MRAIFALSNAQRNQKWYTDQILLVIKNLFVSKHIYLSLHFFSRHLVKIFFFIVSSNGVYDGRYVERGKEREILH